MTFQEIHYGPSAKFLCVPQRADRCQGPVRALLAEFSFIPLAYYRVLLRFTGIYLVVPSFILLFPSFIGSYLVLLGFT